MEGAYHPAAVEAGWSEWWEKENVFVGNAEDAAGASEGRKFVMVIPPPNVTGSLHLGHTLTLSIEDALCRWRRMRGDMVMWFPGVDHAGIATQSVVERRLMREGGISRHDLGREKFLEKVWEWKEHNGNRICEQLRRLGVSVDWQREFFTMDEVRSKAVTEAFVRMHQKGLIFRAERLVSWCPHLQTALSDIEVEVEEIDKPTRIRIPGYEKTVEVGVLWKFYYSIKGSDERIEVATTRIETMLGDVAVAVNPSDDRYKHLIGKQLVHPFAPEREMRVIGDEHCDPLFGTGAVKITPAHDKADYDIGTRHSLEFITIFSKEGTMTSSCGEFAGMHRFECRLKIEKRLEELGLLTDKVPNEHKMQLPRCSRSGDIIEYLLIPQWWVDCKDMAAQAVKAVREKELVIIPDTFEQTWFHWLENIRDWCISRQLWWGHRIPAYKVVAPQQEREMWIIARTSEDANQQAAEKLGIKVCDVELEQDVDVLDTWFSSGLLPMSVCGWPDETADFNAFFPGSLLETGHDILFFWVARMVMQSLCLTGKLPFKHIYLHAMVRDAHGKKMSKSSGNVVDPIEVIEGISLEKMLENLKQGNVPEKEIARAADALKKDFPKGIAECGADALRYGLLAYTRAGRSINLDINRVVAYRHFCNKLWNATKFALLNFPADFRPQGVMAHLPLTWADKWILHRLSACCKLTNEAFEVYDFASAVTATYNFWLYELCDVYLELLKPRLAAQAEDPAALETLYACLDRGLRLLSPMTPFVTEALYKKIPESPVKRRAICLADFPLPVISWTDGTKDKEMTALMAVVKQFRSLFAQLEIPPKVKPRGYIRTQEGPEAVNFLTERAKEIACLSKASEVTVISENDVAPKGCVADVVSDKLEIWVDPEGVVNFKQTLQKLEKKIAVNEKAVSSLQKKVDDADYEKKVPADIRTANDVKMQQLQDEKAALVRAHKNLSSVAETISQ